MSVSESMSDVGDTFPPVPEAFAGALGFPVYQVGQCPKQPPVPRDPFSEEPQTAPEDVIDLYVDDQDTDCSSSSEKWSQRVAQLESKVIEKDKTIHKLKGTVNELADAVAKG